ncbi:unnamed protein product [Bathycoccus prasinos]
MLRDKASAFEAEATVEERIHELLEPAEVSANTFLLKVFHKKASAEVMLSHKKKAYLDAGFAIKECEHEITSGEDAMKLKGVGKSSASLIDKAFEEREKAFEERKNVAKKFFDIVKSKGVRKAYASLPKDAEITLDTDGVLRVNGNIDEDFHARGCPKEKLVEENFFDIVKSKGVREAVASLPKDAEITGGIDGPLRVNGRTNDDFHARGCPFETEIDGVKYIVDGTADYDGFGYDDAYAGLKFSGTLTHLKNKKEYNFSFSYESNQEGYEDLPVDWEGDFEESDIEGIAVEILEDYSFARR